MFTIAVMGSIMLLIATFVFFAAAIMFIVRYTVLILVLILSPLALMGFILPGIKSYADKWKDALIGQAFFAPVYFMLVWISLRVLTGVGDSVIGGKPTAKAAFSALGQPQNASNLTISQEPFALFINFIVVIVFLIAALTIAKSMANKAGGATSSATKWLTGATISGAALTGRHTAGRLFAGLAGSEKLKEKADAGSRSARLALWAGRKGGAASFDARGIGLGIGKTMDAGKAGGKGGFVEFKKKQAKKLEEVAKSYGPSEETLDRAEQAVKKAQTEKEKKAAQTRLDELKGVNQKEVEKRRKEAEKRNKENIEKDPIIEQQRKLEEEIQKREESLAQIALPQLKLEEERKLEAIKKELELATTAARARRMEMETDSKIEIKNIGVITGIGEKRKERYAEVVEKSLWGKMRGYNQAAAAQIRRGKSSKDKLAEAAAAFQKETEPGAESIEEAKKSTSTPENPPKTT